MFLKKVKIRQEYKFTLLFHFICIYFHYFKDFTYKISESFETYIKHTLYTALLANVFF